jgi:ubiquitin-like-conjugating enzyme ATG10
MPEPSATMEFQPSPAAAAAAAAAAPLDPAEHMQVCSGELASFPHLDDSDFENACSTLLAKFRQYGSGQDQWAAVETLRRNEITFLRITKPLLVHTNAPNTSDDVDEVELDEEDDEVAASALPCPAVVHYDVLLSPSYRVPVLYFTIVDSQHRYPPTPETLHSFVIPPTFKSQTEHVGVIGGITTTVRICRS